MIQALHRAGLRVVMDVVYNHTHRGDSWLERTAPGYYYRRGGFSPGPNASSSSLRMRFMSSTVIRPIRSNRNPSTWYSLAQYRTESAM